MDEFNNTNSESFYKTVTENGKTVIIDVSLMDDRLWQLTIHGKKGQMTTWTDWFPTAEKAMQVGESAILQEGIDEFYHDNVFSCFD